MSRILADIKLACGLASRLESVLKVPASVVRFSIANWDIVINTDGSTNLCALLQSALSEFDKRSCQPFVFREQGFLAVLVNTCPDAVTPIVVGFVLPDQAETLIVSLVAAHLEALQSQAEATTTRSQSEYFIDQVTQDFEELTWLRTANEYFDLCGNKHSIESIARKCLPDLASVIRAETIVFISNSLTDTSELGLPDWQNVISTGLIDNRETCARFLSDSIPLLARGPRVVNFKSGEHHLAGYPGLRNCIALSVSKGLHNYGWIVAINKLPSSNANPCETSESEVPDANSFGTFEASLLSAAANIMSSHGRNLELFEAQESLLIGIVRVIINAIDAKDPYTCGHSDRVALYAKRIAARLGESNEECERIYMAGLLHDVGKIGVPDIILGKPGALTTEEYAIVKKHPEIGHTILKHLKLLDYVLPGVLHHHEAVNGSGYPAGLVGEAIPLHGRILAVADAYDAMTSDRPYRPGMPSEKAESILIAEAGKIWDSDIVNVFMECLANAEIQPHTTDSAHSQVPAEFIADANSSLMQRIANSINNLVVR